MQMSAFRLRMGHVLAEVPAFVESGKGAVSVDWVVLTAASLGLALAAFVGVRGGAIDLGTQINGSMTQAWQVATAEPPD